MTVAIEAAASRWRYAAALSALLAVVGAAAVLTVDPRGLAQMGGGVLGAAWLAVPYALVIVLALAGQSIACGGTALAVGVLFFLLLAAAVLLAGGAALAFVAYFSGAVGLQSLLVIIAHAGLLASGLRLVRRADGSATFALAMLGAANLIAAGLIAVQVQRYLASPQRAQAVATQLGVDARGALLQLHRCLVKFHRTRGAYPDGLVEIGPEGTGCALEPLATDQVAGYHLRYTPAPDGQGYELVALVQDPTRVPYDHRRIDQSGALWFNLDPAGTGGTADEDPTSTILSIDVCLEQYRQHFAARGYPDSIASADRDLGCFYTRGALALAENGRSILEIGELLGFRYLYAPGEPDAHGVVRSFRLDLRPVQWGRPLKRSYLCTPEGTLHVTEEDRAAERTDPDMQTDPITGVVRRSWCLGPEVPARR